MLTVIYGTRPEAIKLSKVVEALRTKDVPLTILATGQHWDLLWGTPAFIDLADAEALHLPAHGDPWEWARQAVPVIQERLCVLKPSIVIVQGDTASAYAGAIAAENAGIPIAHVEAGIRSGDDLEPYPEERFRVAIDRLARFGYCATLGNQQACTTDQHCAGMFRVTGNPGIDALYSHTRPIQDPHQVQDRVIVTLHRRESFGDPLFQMTCGIVDAAKRYPSLEFIWPTHPNPEVQRGTAWAFASDGAGVRPPPNLISIDPLPTVAFAQMLAASRCVITDSGGVQEEAAALGVPCVVARDKTDRPESVLIGLADVVGRTRQGILQGLDWALGFMARCTPSDCFGDGNAAPRIADHLLEVENGR